MPFCFRPYRGGGDILKRAFSIVILGVLVLAIVPSGSVGSFTDVGDATVDVFDNPDSVDAYVPDVQDFTVHQGSSPPWPDIVLYLDCEVDDNNCGNEDISTLFHIEGTLYHGESPTILGFEWDDWANPSAPFTDNTAFWPMGRNETDHVSITFSGVPPNPPGYRIECQIFATIYSEGPDEIDTVYDHFTVTIQA